MYEYYLNAALGKEEGNKDTRQDAGFTVGALAVGVDFLGVGSYCCRETTVGEFDVSR